MKKLFVLPALLLFFAAVSFSQNQFILKGKLKGINSGKAELSYSTLNNNKWSENKLETSIVKGNFLFKNKLSEPIVATLKINDLSFKLFIEPTLMSYSMDKNFPEKFTLTGSKTQDDYVIFKSEIAKTQKLLYAIQDTLNAIYQLDDSLKNTFSEKIETLKKQQDEIFPIKKNKLIEFTLSHLDSYYFILEEDLLFFISHDYLSADSARIIFNKLDNKVKKHSCGVQLDTYLKSIENTQVGKSAPNFKTKDVNGKLVTLSDYKGQYVFLDFWASWCTWCVKGLPHSNEFYKKYHDKGLQVIGITSDRSKEEWIKSIEKNQINGWINVMKVNDIEKAQQGYVDYEDIDRKYPTDGIPKYILIDKDGKIINKWDGYSEENEKEMDEVMKNIFGF